jgi:hypothetical protein
MENSPWVTIKIGRLKIRWPNPAWFETGIASGPDKYGLWSMWPSFNNDQKKRLLDYNETS